MNHGFNMLKRSQCRCAMPATDPVDLRKLIEQIKALWLDKTLGVFDLGEE
jgi:hypothetical protein